MKTYSIKWWTLFAKSKLLLPADGKCCFSKSRMVHINSTISRNGYLNFLRVSCSVGGVKVSIVAFQAIDPGSIPGWRKILILIFLYYYYCAYKLNHPNKLLFTFSSYVSRCVGGVKVSIVASQAIDPGSIPGRRKFLISIIFGNLRHQRGIIALQYVWCRFEDHRLYGILLI